MLTTCLAAVVKGNHLLVAHVGDSRAYLLRFSSASRPSITYLTTDHSMVTELVRAGIISPAQMQRSPTRHMVLRALGEHKQDTSYPDMTTCLVQPGDRRVLCCDGLWSELPEEQIAMVVSGHIPQGACAELIRLANEAGGEDTMSAVVLSFRESARKPEEKLLSVVSPDTVGLWPSRCSQTSSLDRGTPGELLCRGAL